MKPVSRRVGFETARLRLANYKLVGDRACATAGRHAAEVCACALSVERVGTWLFGDGGETLTCIDQYRLGANTHEPGESLTSSEYPIYMAALHKRRAIVADDALENPFTRELGERYLIPNGITSMLDAPVIRESEIVGVICLEHTGPKREWTSREIDFACSVGDTAALIMEQAQRLELEAHSRELKELALFEEKMAALAQFSRSIAHDLNNVIGAVGLSAELLRRSPDSDVVARVDEILEASEVGARLVQQLMTLGQRPQTDTQAPATSEYCDVARVLQKLRPMIEATIGSKTTLELQVETDVAMVAASEGDVERIVLNLCLNGAQAMPAGGRLKVLLRAAQPEDELIAQGWLLSVSDDGVGMSAEVQTRIFEPYFTTKPEGTGLGLATVYALVEGFGGQVRVESEPGEGTQVSVALPRVP